MVSEYDNLAKRFLSDLNLPFQFIDMNHFRYCMMTFGFQEEWKEITDIITKEYNGNPNLFLDDFYRVRDNIINDILNNPDYKTFCEIDMSMFELDKESRNLPTQSIYNRDNIGKYFLSIDLKKANFQTLKHINSGIIKNANTYEDFIGMYTNLDYIKNSKYIRQVIFGKCNAKRQITAEKFFINEIRKVIENRYLPTFKLISLTNDEIIYEITNSHNSPLDSMLINNGLNMIARTVKEETDFDVRVELFKLNAYEFQNMETNQCKFTFYEKDMVIGNKILKSIPNTYYKMAYKLLHKAPLCDYDYLFEYDGTMCQFLEEFQIKQIEK